MTFVDAAEEGCALVHVGVCLGASCPLAKSTSADLLALPSLFFFDASLASFSKSSNWSLLTPSLLLLGSRVAGRVQSFFYPLPYCNVFFMATLGTQREKGKPNIFGHRPFSKCSSALPFVFYQLSSSTCSSLFSRSFFFLFCFCFCLFASSRHLHVTPTTSGSEFRTLRARAHTANKDVTMAEAQNHLPHDHPPMSSFVRSIEVRCLSPALGGCMDRSPMQNNFNFSATLLTPAALHLPNQDTLSKSGGSPFDAGLWMFTPQWVFQQSPQEHGLSRPQLQIKRVGDAPHAEPFCLSPATSAKAMSPPSKPMCSDSSADAFATAHFSRDFHEVGANNITSQASFFISPSTPSSTPLGHLHQLPLTDIFNNNSITNQNGLAVVADDDNNVDHIKGTAAVGSRAANDDINREAESSPSEDPSHSPANKLSSRGHISPLDGPILLFAAPTCGNATPFVPFRAGGRNANTSTTTPPSPTSRRISSPSLEKPLAISAAFSPFTINEGVVSLPVFPFRTEGVLSDDRPLAPLGKSGALRDKCTLRMSLEGENDLLPQSPTNSHALQNSSSSSLTASSASERVVGAFRAKSIDTSVDMYSVDTASSLNERALFSTIAPRNETQTADDGHFAVTHTQYVEANESESNKGVFPGGGGYGEEKAMHRSSPKLEINSKIEGLLLQTATAPYPLGLCVVDPILVVSSSPAVDSNNSLVAPTVCTANRLFRPPPSITCTCRAEGVGDLSCTCCFRRPPCQTTAGCLSLTNGSCEMRFEHDVPSHIAEVHTEAPISLLPRTHHDDANISCAVVMEGRHSSDSVAVLSAPTPSSTFANATPIQGLTVDESRIPRCCGLPANADVPLTSSTSSSQKRPVKLREAQPADAEGIIALRDSLDMTGAVSLLWGLEEMRARIANRMPMLLVAVAVVDEARTTSSSSSERPENVHTPSLKREGEIVVGVAGIDVKGLEKELCLLSIGSRVLGAPANSRYVFPREYCMCRGLLIHKDYQGAGLGSRLHKGRLMLLSQIAPHTKGVILGARGSTIEEAMAVLTPALRAYPTKASVPLSGMPTPQSRSILTPPTLPLNLPSPNKPQMLRNHLTNTDADLTCTPRARCLNTCVNGPATARSSAKPSPHAQSVTPVFTKEALFEFTFHTSRGVVHMVHGKDEDGWKFVGVDVEDGGAVWVTSVPLATLVHLYDEDPILSNIHLCPSTHPTNVAAASERMVEHSNSPHTAKLSTIDPPEAAECTPKLNAYDSTASDSESKSGLPEENPRPPLSSLRRGTAVFMG